MYSSGDKFGDNAQKVTIYGKAKEIRQDDKPGPGAYQSKDYLTKDN